MLPDTINKICKEPKKNEHLEKSSRKELSFAKKLFKINRNITVEPYIALFITSSVFGMIAVQNMNMEKACRVNLEYGDEVCTKLINQQTENLTREVQNVQKLVVGMTSWTIPLKAILSSVVLVFIGAWSDRTGRRLPCMVLPIIGEFMVAAGLLLSTFFFLEWPMEVAGLMETIPPGLTGYWATMFMGAFSFLTDITRIDNRTYRIGVASVVLWACIPFGTSLSGILIKPIGYYGIFSVMLVLYTFGITYILLKINEKNTRSEKIGIWGFFHYKGVAETFRVALKRRPGYNRLNLILLFSIYFISMGLDSVSEEPKKNEHHGKPSWTELSFIAKISKINRNITVEPYMALFITSSVFGIIAVQNMNMEKACRVNLKYGDEVCTNLINQQAENLTREDQNVQKLVVSMTSWTIPLKAMLTSVVLVFIGAWSDRTGRRLPCIVLPIIGEIMVAAGLLLSTYFFLEWPMEVVGIIETIPLGITGGIPTMLLGTLSYLVDLTKVENRTFRIGIASNVVWICVPFGTSLSGILIKLIGYYGVFSVKMVLYIVGIVYILLKINETNKRSEQIEICDFFHYKGVSDTFRVALKSRPGCYRLNLILLFSIDFILTGLSAGHLQITYLYSRYRYNFTEIEYSIYSSCTVILHMIGMVIGLFVLSQHFKIHDALLGVLATAGNAASSLNNGMAGTRAEFYVGPIIDIFSGFGSVATRSLVSKLIEPNETGKVFSLLGLIQSISPVAFVPLFNKIYQNTIHIQPGIYLFTSSFLAALTAIMFLVIYRLSKLDEKQKEDKEKNTNGENYCYDNEVTSL